MSIYNTRENSTEVHRYTLCRDAAQFEKTVLIIFGTYFVFIVYEILAVVYLFRKRQQKLWVINTLRTYALDPNAGHEFDVLALHFAYQGKIEGRFSDATPPPGTKNVLTYIDFHVRTQLMKESVFNDICRHYGLPTTVNAPYYGFDPSKQAYLISQEMINLNTGIEPWTLESARSTLNTVVMKSVVKSYVSSSSGSTGTGTGSFQVGVNL